MDNFEQIVLLLVSGQGILLSCALLSTIFKRNHSSFYLGLIAAVMTIEILNIWAMRVSYHNLENAFPFWVLGSYLIIPAALWLFVKANTQPSFRSKRKYFILFIPALVEIIVELISFYSNRFPNKDYELQENLFWYTLTEIVPVIAMVLILILFARKLLDLNVYIKGIIATGKTNVQISRLYSFFGVFSLLTVFWLLQSVLQVQVFIIIETVLLLFVFVLGYIGYFHPSFIGIPKILKTDMMKNKFSHYNDEFELERLKALFEDRKIYRQQKLSVKDVSDLLNLPERYVSALINSNYDTNFNSYVNSFRVADTIKRIKDPKEKNKTLLGIAMESGFNSKSSFNQIFKATTGKNPSDFLNV